MTELVWKKAKDTLGDPRDTARKVIVHAVKPETRPWDPEQRTLIHSMMANAYRKKSFTLEVPPFDTTLAKPPDTGASPEEAALDNEAAREAEERLAMLREELSRARARLLLSDAAERGERHAHRAAEEAGCSYREPHDRADDTVRALLLALHEAVGPMRDSRYPSRATDARSRARDVAAGADDAGARRVSLADRRTRHSLRFSWCPGMPCFQYAETRTRSRGSLWVSRRERRTLATTAASPAAQA